MLIGRYVIDYPRSGLDNMAIDQAMLEQTAVDSIIRVRFYRWIEPTVSLGYFQKFQDFLDYEAGRGRPVVRRATGGEAIVHHYDWTYSISVPAVAVSNKRQLGASAGLYDNVHQTVVDWLLSIGISAALWSSEDPGRCRTTGQGDKNGQVNRAGQVDTTEKGDQADTGDRAREGKPGACHFLCFHRRHAGDVVVEGCKVLGSAQRRHEGAILQHGSLLLSQSPYAPSLLGLQQLARQQTNYVLEDFSDRIIRAISECYHVNLQKWDSAAPLAPPNDSIKERLESRQWIGRI